MLSKPLILVIAVLLSFALLFGYLSYTFYGKKVEAETKLTEVIGQLSSMQESYDKQAKSCLIADSISAELQEENRKLEEKNSSLLDKIDKLPSKKPVKPTEVSKNEVDIDAKLPPELSRVLSDAYYDSKGKANALAR